MRKYTPGYRTTFFITVKTISNKEKGKQKEIIINFCNISEDIHRDVARFYLGNTSNKNQRDRFLFRNHK